MGFAGYGEDFVCDLLGFRLGFGLSLVTLTNLLATLTSRLKGV